MSIWEVQSQGPQRKVGHDLTLKRITLTIGPEVDHSRSRAKIENGSESAAVTLGTSTGSGAELGGEMPMVRSWTCAEGTADGI